MVNWCLLLQDLWRRFSRCLWELLLGDVRGKWLIGSYPTFVKDELMGLSSRVLLDCASMSGMISHECPKLSQRVEVRYCQFATAQADQCFMDLVIAAVAR